MNPICDLVVVMMAMVILSWSCTETKQTLYVCLVVCWLDVAVVWAQTVFGSKAAYFLVACDFTRATAWPAFVLNWREEESAT
jgi:hypothetical protein